MEAIYENRSKPTPYLIRLVIWNNIYPSLQSLSVGDKQLITIEGCTDPSSHYVLLKISGILVATPSRKMKIEANFISYLYPHSKHQSVSMLLCFSLSAPINIKTMNQA